MNAQNAKSIIFFLEEATENLRAAGLVAKDLFSVEDYGRYKKEWGNALGAMYTILKPTLEEHGDLAPAWYKEATNFKGVLAEDRIQILKELEQKKRDSKD